MGKEALTLSRYLARETDHSSLPQPDLSTLYGEMAHTAKVLARELQRAALAGRLGTAGERNPTGDAQKKLDFFANQVVLDAFAETGLTAAVVSEELAEPRTFTCSERSAYILCIDPLDGSSNTDINGAMGTIFGFYRRSATGPCKDIVGELRAGAKLVAAGYKMYGPSTVLVFAHGNGVNGFTLDFELGEFFLSHEEIRCPEQGHYYSANLDRYPQWDSKIRSFVDYLTENDPATKQPYSLRYVGAFVADLHRILIEGGISFYPQDKEQRNGKLRLLYERAPIAFVVEQAGGRASTGRERILDITPESLHQRAPLAIDNRKDVALSEKFFTEGNL